MTTPKKPPPPPSNAMRALLKRAAPKPNAPSGPQQIGRYRILSKIGAGGHGAVYRAIDAQTETPVALKVLHGHVVSDELKLRMKREAYAMSQLEDTSAVQVYECSEDQGQLFLAMEFLDGQDLAQTIAQLETRGPIPIATTIELLTPIVETLRVAHERRIIHRDLKPENIFVLREGGVRLVDFGLVKDLSLAQLTEVGTVAGSPGYIAPEAWAGNPDKIDHRIDVYSLGVLVFRMVGGQRPFEPGESLLDFILTVSKAERPSLRALRAELGPEIDAWARRALAVEPGERHQTVSELWASFLAAAR